MKHKLLAMILVLLPLTNAQAAGSLFIDDMTWVEVRSRIAQGADIVIVPIGAVEQSGPQMATGKHNFIVRHAAGEIARTIGNVLVAPVIPFSPSGRIYPPEGNMQFPGTISVRSETLAMMIEDVANSLKQHGFRLICLVGDNSGSQYVQQQVAARLNNSWASQGVQLLHVSGYGDSAEVELWARNNGAMTMNPNAHAGMVETSELMAVSPQHVRNDQISAFSERDYAATGAIGDASQSNSTFGRGVLSVKINAAVQQIKLAASRP